LSQYETGLQFEEVLLKESKKGDEVANSLGRRISYRKK
jgi:hypothetical protein